MKIKKLLGLSMVLILVFVSVLSGCRDENTQDSTEKNDENDLGSITLVKPDWLGNLDNKNQNELIKKEIEKEIFEQTGKKLDVNIVFYPGGDYYNTLSTLIVSNRPVDAVNMWYPNGGFISYAARPNLAKPLDEFLGDYENLRNSIPEQSWKSVTLDGKIMAIPSVVFAQNYTPLIRKDWLDEAGLPVPETLQELNAAFEAFKEMGNMPFSHQLWQIERWLCGSLGIPYTDFEDEDGMIWDKFFHPNYIYFMDILRDWYSKGYIPRDFLSARWQETEQMFLSGALGTTITYYGNLPSFYYTMKQVDENAEIINLPMFDAGVAEPGIAAENTTTEISFILERSNNPKGVLAYFDWKISRPENYILATEGIDGVHVDIDFENKTRIVSEKYENNPGDNYPGTFGMLDWTGVFHDWTQDSRIEYTRKGLDLMYETINYLNTTKRYYSPTSGKNFEHSSEALLTLLQSFERRDSLIARYITGEVDRDRFLEEQQSIKDQYRPVSVELTEIINRLSE